MNSLHRSLRSIRVLAATSLVLLISGCLTIEENYTFKKDGSGTMEYVVDMSDLKDMAGMMDNKERKKSRKKDDGPITGSDAKVAALKSLEGIKKVKLKSEQDGFVQRISFAFKNVDALNKALNVLMPDSTGAQQAFFRWEGSTLVRTNNLYAEELGKEMNGSDTTGSAELLKAMHYKYSFKFAKDVQDTRLADGVTKESPNARKLELATDWSVIMKDPEALDLRITLAK
ncbi:MAG TPA: hypothetical protein PLV70_04950 [Flavobacteriales bacterium]|nr:hypothetical protein [Flavobacteriales bacterium]HRO40928.1 hypothetical protein [Flavobacteriales bacterium]HRP81240.1 hypothetical protein [Flavobacteriales bacterium]HRQ84441.1 hypothetical protein [Flavobacteriales bacterium]